MLPRRWKTTPRNLRSAQQAPWKRPTESQVGKLGKNCWQAVERRRRPHLGQVLRLPTVTTPTNLTESQLAEVAASYLLADPEVGADHEDAGTAAGHAMPAGAMHVGRRGCRSGRRTPRGHRRRTSTDSRYSLVGLLIFLSFPLLHTEQRPQNAPLPPPHP